MRRIARAVFYLYIAQAMIGVLAGIVIALHLKGVL
jgi:hypothetical protein